MYARVLGGHVQHEEAGAVIAVAGFSVEAHRPIFRLTQIDDKRLGRQMRDLHALRLAASVSQYRTASRPSPSGGFQPALTRPDAAGQVRGSIDRSFSVELLLLVFEQLQRMRFVGCLAPEYAPRPAIEALFETGQISTAGGGQV